MWVLPSRASLAQVYRALLGAATETLQRAGAAHADQALAAGLDAFECVAAPDEYADADGIRSNGCELLVEHDVLHVSVPINGGFDAIGCGTWDQPCATIAFID